MIVEKFSSDLFIKRTKEIIKQYSDKFSSELDKYYDVTLSINCLYGLLMMPSKKYFDQISEEEAVSYLPKRDIDNLLIKVSAKDLKNNTDRSITFKEMVTGIRNGLAHWEQNSNKWDGRNNINFITDEVSKYVKTVVIKGPINDYQIEVEVTFDVTKINTIMKLIELLPTNN
jgi:hypothetical protein